MINAIPAGTRRAMESSLIVLVLGVFFAARAGADVQVTKAYVEPEVYYYPHKGAEGQKHGNLALTGAMELYSQLNQDWSFKANPYARTDAVDSNRNRVDLKDFYAEYFDGQHTLDLGIRQVSWSTVEAVNVLPLQVADLINQRDIAGDPAGQDKLGAPTVRYAYQTEALQFEAYLLPWFRERTLPSREARENFTRGMLELDADDPLFTDAKENHRTSYALRAEWVTGEANLALLHYNGYRQDPLFVPAQGNRLRPLYYLVKTTAFTAQASIGSWLYKAEIAYNDTHGNHGPYAVPSDFVAGVGGAEYTFIRPEAQADLSLFGEYIYDSRNDGPLGTPFDDDLFVGVRWASNDQYDSTLIVGVVADISHSTQVFHLNFKRRLSDAMSMEMTLRGYAPDEHDPLYPLRYDHLLNASLFYYF